MLIEKITSGNSNDQLLYFTSSSLLKNDDGLIFISDRTGNPNLFYLDLVTKTEKQLTFNEDGYLKSYVYFDGNVQKGLGKASICLHSGSGTIFYIHGNDICRTDLSGNTKILASLPDNQGIAFTCKQ